MSTIDFSHLRPLAVYATVVERGSFAAAARHLHSSRSRVSEQVAALEADLGVRLLQRSTRQLSMTPEGEAVYAQAQQLPQLLNQIEAIVTPETPQGRVAITMNHDIAHKYILPILPDFRARYPDIELDLILDDAPLDLIDEQIDLGIRIGFPKDDSLIARVMHEERFSLFASPDYLAQVGKIDSLAALAECDWVLLNQELQSGKLRFLQDDRIVEIKPRSGLSCNSPLMMQQMVLKGLGIGALLPTTISAELANGQLQAVFPQLRSELLVFALVYPSRHQVPLRTRVVIDYLLAANIFALD